MDAGYFKNIRNVVMILNSVIAVTKHGQSITFGSSVSDIISTGNWNPGAGLLIYSVRLFPHRTNPPTRLDGGLNVLRLFSLQEAVWRVTLERPLQRVSEKFGHAIVQLDGRAI